MARLFRTGGSLGIVLIAYWAYAVVAVPLIEPPVERYESGPVSPGDWGEADGRVGHRLKELAGLFPPGSWELKSPQILESDGVKLLVQGYANGSDGRVEFDRCTIVLTPDESVTDRAERQRRTVVLQASDGAVLKFDPPLTLRQANLGGLRLESGMLKGRVTIRSQGKSAGPEDDLFIATRDVELTEDEISTDHAVEFRMGRNHGSGSRMRIGLLAGKKEARKRGFNVTGIEWFELRRLDQLCLWLSKPPDIPGRTRKPKTGGASPDGGVSIEITCRGPFRYDHIRQEASFEDQVDVVQINPEGPADRIAAERLSVFFARSRRSVTDLSRPGSPDTASESSGEFDLQPCRIEARGNPVDVNAPSQDVFARGERLVYDLQQELIVLDAPNDGRQHMEVSLRQGPNEIHGRSLRYQSMGPGRLGRVTAVGPGWIRAQTEDLPPRKLHATWGDQLHVRPHDGRQVISLKGNPELTFSQFGRLTAGEIHFWLFELPPDDSAPKGQPRLRPDRMSALGDVRLDSPQLTGAVEKLEVWFEEEVLAEPGPDSTHAATGRITGVLPVYRSAEPEGWNDRGSAGETESGREQQFDITGKVLTSLVAIRDGEPELSELTVEGNVVLRETRTAKPDEIPLIMTGDQVQVFEADTPQARVVVVGLNPLARLEGRGLELEGTNITLDRGSNWVRINGGGQMNLPVDRDLDGEPLARPGVLNIDWQEKMEFNGRTISFFESVVATGPNLRMTTQRLHVSLAEVIDFADPDMDREPDVGRIECQGGAVMDSWSFDGPTQTSWERVESADLSLDRISGKIFGRGPGRITTVRLGKPELASPFIRGRDAERPDPAEDDKDELTYVNVEFEDRFEGNLHDRTVTLHDQVHCVYGPVVAWDTVLDMDDPDSLGLTGALLRSDALTVTRMTTPLEGVKSIELLAQGNVTVKGSRFNAWGDRMTYDQAKDLLILEGTGRADAELFYQERKGEPQQHAQMGTIRYRLKTNQLQIGNARSLEFSQFPTQ